MKARHFFILLVGALAVGIAGAVLASTVLVSPNADRSALAATQGALAELDRRLAATEAELERVREQSRQAQATSEPATFGIERSELDSLRSELRAEFAAALERVESREPDRPRPSPSISALHPVVLDDAIERVLQARDERAAREKLQRQLDRTHTQLAQVTDNINSALSESLSLSPQQSALLSQTLNSRQQHLERVYEEFYTAQAQRETYNFSENRKPIEDEALRLVRQILTAQQQVPFEEQLGQGTLDHIGWRYQRANRRRGNLADKPQRR